MVPQGYKEVSEGVYESDAFLTERPVIDSARVQQILNNLWRSPPACSNDSRENSTEVARENEHSGA